MIFVASLRFRPGHRAHRRCCTGFLGVQVALPLMVRGHLFDHLHLNLLNFQQPLPLVGEQFIDFGVQVADFEFSLQIGFEILLGAQAILGFLAVLAHHDHWRLDGRHARAPG